MTSYTVRARRWSRGWELHIDGVGVTQSRTLDGAEAMVRDYIETLTDQAVSAGDDVVIVPEVGGGLDAEARAAREAIAQAERAMSAAALGQRRAAGRLADAGLSGRDIAAVLGVSAQRVSQLLAASAPASRAS